MNIQLNPFEYLLLAHSAASMAMLCAKQGDLATNQGILAQLDLAEKISNTIFAEYPQYQGGVIRILEICRQTRRLCQDGTPCNFDEFNKICQTTNQKTV